MSKEKNDVLDRVRTWLDKHPDEERGKEIQKALAAYEANRLNRVKLKDALETNAFEGKLLKKELARVFKASKHQELVPSPPALPKLEEPPKPAPVRRTAVRKPAVKKPASPKPGSGDDTGN